MKGVSRMECVEMSGYFQRLERFLDCPKPLRSSFLNQTRRMAEDFVQGKPDTTQQELADYLGEPQELAQGFLETLEPDVLERYHRRKKFLRRGCVAVVVIALIGAVAWSIYLWNEPIHVETTETLVVYPIVTEEIT